MLSIVLYQVSSYYISWKFPLPFFLVFCTHLTLSFSTLTQADFHSYDLDFHFKFSSPGSANLKAVLPFLLECRNIIILCRGPILSAIYIFLFINKKIIILEYFVSSIFQNYCYLITFTGRHWTWMQMLCGFRTAVQLLSVLWVEFL